MEAATARYVKGVSPHEFVKAYVAHLKRSGKIELPPWTNIVKGGKLKELPPLDPDWYYVRVASMARKIYLRGGLGVGSLRKIYGGAKRNGSRPHHFCKSSGSIARHILQQLQNVNIVDFDTKGGRKITSNGQRDIDQVAGRIAVSPLEIKHIAPTTNPPELIMRAFMSVLGFGVIWWSVATILTPIAARISLPFLLVMRAFMGIGEGMAMPAINNLLSKWIPVSERSRSLALVYRDMYLGSVTGLGFSPILIQKFGWPSFFYLFGSLGSIWFALWLRNVMNLGLCLAELGRQTEVSHYQ